MIQEFLFRLHGCMDDTNNSISSIYNVPWFNMIPLKVPDNELTEWSNERYEIPCLNVDCEWVQYMMLFYRSRDLFLLPGLKPNGYCKICQMAKEHKLNRSLLRITGKNTVQIIDKSD